MVGLLDGIVVPLGEVREQILGRTPDADTAHVSVFAICDGRVDHGLDVLWLGVSRCFTS